MNKLFLALFCAVAFVSSALAQEPVLTIGNDKITSTEFLNVYKKNNTKANALAYDSLKNYMDLFLNFKLKVKEAKEMGLDTGKAFVNELRGYRKQLAMPYLTDKEVNDKLLNEAYDRSKIDINASHILIKLDPDALPKDTLAAYKKAMDIRGRILKGENFNSLAEKFSDDPSVKENKGNLGYFTVFNMVYPFENAAYTTKKGEVSMPVRTRFGYHIVRVEDVRDAQGSMRVAHIMVKIPKDAKKSAIDSAKTKIDEINAKLKAGEKFEDLAKQFSDDKQSAKKGGELPWFGTGRMVESFENASFALKNDGDISAPTLTNFGWHIIKRLEKKPVPTFNEVQSDYKNKIAKDQRSEKSRVSLVSRIKTENNFTEDRKALDEVIKAVDSTLYLGAWNIAKAAGLNKPLFKFGTTEYTQQDFAKYISSRQAKRNKDAAIATILNSFYDKMIEESAINYEDSRLEQKYPAFNDLLNEYRDGMLLFEITDKKVWSKAVEDTTGLRNYYEANKTKYLWPERVEATVYKCANANVAKRLRKLLKKNKKKPLTNDAIVKAINTTSSLDLAIETVLATKGENEVVDKTNWVLGLSSDIADGKSVYVVDVKKVIPPTPKTIAEARGLITADYQSYLEKTWIEALRKKYPYTVNDGVLRSIAK